MLTEIENFFSQLPENKKEIALAVRNFLHSVDSNLAEKIMWGNYTLLKDKEKLVFIYSYKNVEYVNIGFLKATSLSDPKKLFEGTGKGMRHIKINSVNEIPKQQLKNWLKESIILSR